MNTSFPTSLHKHGCEGQFSFGWSAMSAFGEASNVSNDAELVAEFIAKARQSAAPQSDQSRSFWNSLVQPLKQAQMAVA